MFLFTLAPLCHRLFAGTAGLWLHSPALGGTCRPCFTPLRPSHGDSQAPSTGALGGGSPRKALSPHEAVLPPPCRPASMDLREGLPPQRLPPPPPGPTEDLISTDAGAGPASCLLPPSKG